MQRLKKTPLPPALSPPSARVRFHLHTEPRQFQSRQQTERREHPSKAGPGGEGRVEPDMHIHTHQENQNERALRGQCAHVRAHFSKRLFALESSFPPSLRLPPRPTTLGGACVVHAVCVSFARIYLSHTVFCHVTLDTVVLQAPSTLVLLLTIVCLGVKERMCDVMM